MMTFNKKSKSLIAVYAIVAVIYMLFFLLIPFEKNAASWISFAFTVVSFVVSFGITMLAFKDGETLVSRVYGYPIFRIGMIYMLLQLGAGALICIVAAFVDVPYWVALLLSVLLLGGVAIGVVATDNIKEIVENEDERVRVATKAITTFNIDMAGILDSCDNVNVKKELEGLVEAFRYSDPMSSDATAQLEDELVAEVDSLKMFVLENDTDKILAQIKMVKNKLNERNRVCKANK